MDQKQLNGQRDMLVNNKEESQEWPHSQKTGEQEKFSEIIA